MTQSSGYFFDGSKSAGLINTPSITVLSLLFQETTSRVPMMKLRVCSVIFVNARGEKLRTLETKTSLSDVGELAVNAICFPSRVRENDPAIKLSGPEIRVIFALTGSRRKRCEDVFCWAAK